MERIERNGGRGSVAGPKAETVFVFDIFGTLHEVVCDRRGECEPPARRREKEEIDASTVSPSVIRRWLAGFALAIVGLGLSVDPSAARGVAEPAAVEAVLQVLL